MSGQIGIMNTPLFSSQAVDWHVSLDPVDYPQAVAFMEARAAAIAKREARELVWLLEHPPLYTAGTSAKEDDLVSPDRFAVYKSGRGGQYTYHGPGQRVAYILLDLSKRGKDIRCFVNQLERLIMDTLASFGVSSGTRQGRVGVWVDQHNDGGERTGEAKIAAIGVRVRKWVTFHGISINVDPDLSHFTGIVPCGIAEHGVTSLSDMGISADMGAVDAALRRAFEARFGTAETRLSLNQPY